MGFGEALGEIQIGSRIVAEHAYITTVMAPITTGHTSLLFNVEGLSPMAMEQVDPSTVRGAGGRFGERIITQVPVIQTWPEGPNVSVMSIASSIGATNLVYYRKAHHRRIAFKPIGMPIPPICPLGGFPFDVTLQFLDGSQVTATTAVPCLPRAGGK